MNAGPDGSAGHTSEIDRAARRARLDHGLNGRRGLLKQLDPFARQLGDERAQAGDVAERLDAPARRPRRRPGAPQWRP